MPHQSPDTIIITVDTPGVADIEPNPYVGRIYDIAINGVGYMLADNPEMPDSLPSTLVPSLDPPRLATSDTPFAQAVERYTFERFHDWEAGRGQRWLNREEATSRAFWESEGVDPFTVKGQLSLLPSMSQLLAETYSGLRVAAVGDDLYAVTDTDEISRFIGSSEMWASPFQVSGAGTILDLATDGQYWYACDGSAIYRGTTSDPGGAWSSEPAVQIRWAGGRICAAVTAGSSTTPNRFTTLAPDGTEEQENGHLTLDEGHTIVLGGSAQGVFYFGSYAGDRGSIWAWQLGVDSEGAFHVPFEAWPMPPGLIPTAVATAGGEVWVRALQSEGPNAGQVYIYRGVPGQGLTPFLVAELGVTEPEGGFSELNDMVLFSWSNHARDEAALGAVYLPTGGHARWLLPHVDGPIPDIVEWRGREVVAVQGHGVYIRDVDSWETEGWLETSLVDGGSALDKVLDTITVESTTLMQGQSIEVQYSLDAGHSYLTAINFDAVGARRMVANLSQRAGSWGLRLVLRGSGESSTTLTSAQGKYHPLGLRDTVFRLRVKAYDNMTGVNGAPLPTNGPGVGARMMRDLEALGQQRVLLQDVDWHITGEARVVEVIQVETRRIIIRDPKKGANAVGGTVDLILRRPCGMS